MESEYIRKNDLLEIIRGLDVAEESEDRFRLLGKGIYVEIVPLKRGFLEHAAGVFVGDKEAKLNPQIEEIIVEGNDNLLDYRVEGGQPYVKAYLNSMGLKVEGPRKKPHIVGSISGDFDPQNLGAEIDDTAWKISKAQYKISNFPAIASSAFDSASKKYFGLSNISISD